MKINMTLKIIAAAIGLAASSTSLRADNYVNVQPVNWSGPELKVTGVAWNDTLNMRAGPGTGYDVIKLLPSSAEDLLPSQKAVLSDGDVWVYVRWLDDNSEGWVAVRHLVQQAVSWDDKNGTTTNQDSTSADSNQQVDDSNASVPDDQAGYRGNVDGGYAVQNSYRYSVTQNQYGRSSGGSGGGATPGGSNPYRTTFSRPSNVNSGGMADRTHGPRRGPGSPTSPPNRPTVPVHAPRTNPSHPEQPSPIPSITYPRHTPETIPQHTVHPQPAPRTVRSEPAYTPPARPQQTYTPPPVHIQPAYNPPPVHTQPTYTPPPVYTPRPTYTPPVYIPRPTYTPSVPSYGGTYRRY